MTVCKRHFRFREIIPHHKGNIQITFSWQIICTLVKRWRKQPIDATEVWIRVLFSEMAMHHEMTEYEIFLNFCIMPPFRSILNEHKT